MANKTLVITLSSIYRKNSKAADDSIRAFRSVHGRSTLDGTRIDVSFATNDSPVLDSSGNAIVAPHVYAAPFHSLERAVDSDTKEEVSRKDGTPCYRLVLDEEAIATAVDKALAAGVEPSVNADFRKILDRGDARPVREGDDFIEPSTSGSESEAA